MKGNEQIPRRHREWVRENLPAVAMQGDKAIDRLIRLAQDSMGGSTKAVFFLMGIGGAVAGPILVSWIFGEQTGWRNSLATLLGAFVGGVIGFYIEQAVFYRRLRQFAELPDTLKRQ